MEMLKPVRVKNIMVYDKNDEGLSLCTYIRANKLVLRGCAIWIDRQSIKLLVNGNDRKQMRREIIKEANRICYICGEYIPEDVHPTLDHLTPKVKRGGDSKDNLRCCCKRCNDNKANMFMEDYVMDMTVNTNDYFWITDERLLYLVKKYLTK